MSSECIPLKLHRIADDAGYHLEYRPIVRRRGWPEPSAKPWAIFYKDGSHLASFATLRAMENALRARAGC